ncbi:probable inactive protein kinase DDB_G0270444 isoform X2 [Pseudorasbora parva]|uniref:probable inactive protein kinase DDB_G0270444 isoform X2 n=1 Tax=Pseudorasbora parva TaxID=51549 RepID=UPI00351EEC3F
MTRSVFVCFVWGISTVDIKQSLLQLKWQKKQEELKKKKWFSIQKTTDLKKEVHQCKKAVISYKRSAQAAVENSDRIFNEIIRSIQNIQTEVRENIRAQLNKEVHDAENHIQSLEQEMGKLQEENCKLEPLLRIENHIHFFQLQKYSLHSGVSTYTSSRGVSNLTFERVEQSLSELKRQLDEVCEEHMGGILDDVADVQIFQDDDFSEDEEEEEEELEGDNLWGGFEY